MKDKFEELAKEMYSTRVEAMKHHEKLNEDFLNLPSNVKFKIDLSNCFLITGDLSNLKQITKNITP